MGLARTLAVVCFGLSFGCATIGSGQPVHTDVPVATGEQEQPSGETVDVEQSGTALTLRARKLCNVVETREVARTTTTPRENKSAWADWTLGVGGAAIAGAGAVTVIDSGNVSSSDETSRTYNPMGSTGAMVLGVSLIAVGVAGGAAALVDVVRASGADESTSRVSLPGEKELRRGVACKDPVPVADVELALLLLHARGDQDERIALGKTSSEGVLRVDLERVVSDELDGAKGAYVFRDGAEVGKVDLVPVQAAHEESAWSKLDKTACAEPKRSDACKPFITFLKKYPKGPHYSEAARIVEKGYPALAALEDAEAWAALTPDDCARPAGRDIAGAELMCDRLQQYVDTFPSGKHVAEAKAAIAKGRPAIKQHNADQARLAREEEAAEKRREQEAKACPKRCAALCGGYENGSCISACEHLECGLGASNPQKIPCMRRCAGMCTNGYGNTRCVGRCVLAECGVDPR